MKADNKCWEQWSKCHYMLWDVNGNSFKDDDAPYANGVLTTSVVIFLSYIQNCLLPAFLIVRLPWVVGFLGFWEFLLAVAFDLVLVWLLILSKCFYPYFITVLSWWLTNISLLPTNPFTLHIWCNCLKRMHWMSTILLLGRVLISSRCVGFCRTKSSASAYVNPFTELFLFVVQLSSMLRFQTECLFK